MPGRLEGKIALVTGGSSGIGLATVRRFVKEGAHVFLTGRRQVELDAAANAVGGQVTAVRADASSLSDLDTLYAQIKQEKGRLDIVFANAGAGAFAPARRNYGGALRSDLRYERERHALHRPEGAAPDAGWSVGHHDLLHGGRHGHACFQRLLRLEGRDPLFARSWTTDLKDRRIRVNVISPGPIETPGVAGLAPDEEQRKGLYMMLASKVPLGRMGQPDEIAKVAVFLASDDASFVTGIELFADGGAAQV